MKKLILSLAVIALVSVAVCSCGKDKTTYTVQYSFDNTEMQTDMVKVFECKDGSASGKWRCEHHTIQKVMVDGVEHEMVSGTINDVATGDVNELWVYAEGDRKKFTSYDLDTIFRLQPGVNNVFVITPDTKWNRNPLY